MLRADSAGDVDIVEVIEVDTELEDEPDDPTTDDPTTDDAVTDDATTSDEEAHD